MDDSWLDGLNEAQRAAVEHDRGPLVVAAGAGTGKTRTLTARVARLLESAVPPERILLLTFTRRAAASMTSRAAALSADPALAQRVWGGTFHAVAHRIVSEHAQHLGLSEVTVIDPSDVVDLLDLMRAEHSLDSSDRRLPTSQTLADVYSRAVNTGLPARAVMEQQFPWCLDHMDAINELLRGYGARKRARGLLDFDDLLLYWRALLADEDTGARLRARWDWVLVDEYQDVNQVQVDIVRLLCPDGDGLTVVGDDAQTIYGFRGASSEHLAGLARELPDSTVVTLDRSYRSTQQVLDLANVVRPGELPISLVADRPERGARPELVACANADDEARTVADAVLAAHADGLELRRQAVLMRTGSHGNLLEVELKVRNIPYVKYGGISYLETAHVRDLIAAFRVADNPADEVSWYRLLTRHRAIGKVHARVLATRLADGGLEEPAEVVAAAPASARTALDTTLTALASARRETSVVSVVERCRDAVGPLLRAHYPDWTRRQDDVTRFAEAAARQPDLAAFVAEQTIDPANVAADWAGKPTLDEDWLTLTTIHSAKGLEWDAVHVIRACDGAMPSDRALASPHGLVEEQRLFYVALTRARDTLRVYTPAKLPTHPTSFHARHVLAKPTRFLDDRARAAMQVAQPEQRQRRSNPAPVTRVEVPVLDDLFA